MRCGCCFLEKKIILSFVLIFSKVVIIFFLKTALVFSCQHRINHGFWNHINLCLDTGSVTESSYDLG